MLAFPAHLDHTLYCFRENHEHRDANHQARHRAEHNRAGTQCGASVDQPETKRYGEYSKPGEFVYDHPFQWGSRRIGPDLAREGGRQSSFWHWRHFENPNYVSPGSVMPSYEHLLVNDLNFDAIAPHVKAASQLGVPYTDEELNNTAEVAFKQAERVAAEIVAQGGPAGTFDKQAVAVIAYLQRMGTDLYRTPEPEGEQAVPADGAPAEGEPAAESDAEVAEAADANGDVAMADNAVAN